LPRPVAAFLMSLTFGPHTYYVGPRLLRAAKAVEKSLLWPSSPKAKRTTAASDQTTDSVLRWPFDKIYVGARQLRVNEAGGPGP
jgi:hypothetical protein